MPWTTCDKEVVFSELGILHVAIRNAAGGKSEIQFELGGQKSLQRK